jgi:hypothetical protein
LNLDSETSRPAIQTGRVDTGLGPLQIQIVDSTGTYLFDPNTVKLAVLAAETPALFGTEKVNGLAPTAKLRYSTEKEVRIEPLNLAKPVGPSDLSGEPGYLYRTHDVQILLTKEELCRLVLRRLFPSEALQLLKRFGEFFEIHNDFYDPDTGEAFQ